MALQRQMGMAGDLAAGRIYHEAELLVIAVGRDEGGGLRHVVATDDGGDMLIVPGDMFDWVHAVVPLRNTISFKQSATEDSVWQQSVRPVVV